MSPVASTPALPPAADRIISLGQYLHKDAIPGTGPPVGARHGTGGVSLALHGVVPSGGRGSVHLAIVGAALNGAAIAQIRIMTSFWS